MRTILFSTLILVLCVGCPQMPPDLRNSETVEPVAVPEPNRPLPHVEPLVPRERPAEAIMPSEEATEEEVVAPEMTGITSNPQGNYAAEVVPLPPVDDLAAQIDDYMTRMGQSMDFLRATPRYVASAADVIRDSNALALIALALGLAEDDSRYKRSAPHIIAAAQSLAAAQNYSEGRRAFEELRRSLTNTDEGAPLSWSDRVAGLTPVMQALPNLSAALKRITDTEPKLHTNLERQPQRIFSQLAALAAISQGSIPLVDETERPDAMEEWTRYCEEFRDAAIKANAAAHQFARKRADGGQPEYSIFRTAFLAMLESCDDCHRAFYPRAVGLE